MKDYIEQECFSIELLGDRDKEYLKKQINLYLDKLNIKIDSGDLSKLQFIKVWNGFGTVNIHAIPIFPYQDMLSFINSIYEIYTIIENDKSINIPKNMREEYESLKTEIHLIKDYKLKIFSIIAYSLIFESKEKSIYNLGKFIKSLIEVNE